MNAFPHVIIQSYLTKFQTLAQDLHTHIKQTFFLKISVKISVQLKDLNSLIQLMLKQMVILMWLLVLKDMHRFLILTVIPHLMFKVMNSLQVILILYMVIVYKRIQQHFILVLQILIIIVDLIIIQEDHIIANHVNLDTLVQLKLKGEILMLNVIKLQQDVPLIIMEDFYKTEIHQKLMIFILKLCYLVMLVVLDIFPFITYPL